MAQRFCVECGCSFDATNAWHKYCSGYCKNLVARRHLGRIPLHERGRFCRNCGVKFYPPPGKENNNRWHCSDSCSASSARNARSAFWRKQGDPRAKMTEYRQRSKERVGPDGNLKRFHRRHPDVELRCRSCGEDRVVDIAHKPEHKRNGAWRSVVNTVPDKIWILCPTCHALLDRMNYTPEELGLR